MSCDFYFVKWKVTLRHLEDLVHLDQDYQKAKDKTLCEAVVRLSGMLGEYIAAYNDALDCFQHNLQVQKTKYLLDVVRAVTNRILELKHELRKLECSYTQFLGHGLTIHKLTTHDAELGDVPTHVDRPDSVKTAVDQAFAKAEEKRDLLRKAEAEELENLPDVPAHNWWDEDVEEEQIVAKDEEQETEKMIQTRQMAALIQAHERSRKVIRQMRHDRLKRETWEKELLGIANPPARLELRDRAARIIQKVCRVFFEIKRKKKRECQQDEILGIRLCGKANYAQVTKNAELKQLRQVQRKEFQEKWEASREKLRQDFIKLRSADLADDYRDLIRDWFKKWFDDIKYFNDIPGEEVGGSVLIMKEEIPDPIEWWETYKTYQEEKEANKNKSALQKKWAQMEAKQEEMMRKKEEQMKKKRDAEFMKKLMKNPTLHPGFKYPASKKIEHILQVIENYHKYWDDLDDTEVLKVKKQYVIDVDKSNIYAEAKADVMQTVDEDMRQELKILSQALKRDYQSNGEKYPEPMKKPKKRARRKKRVKAKMSEGIADKMENLAFNGILKEYPPTNLNDFLGDHNYAGDDLRCNNDPAVPFCGEARGIWWERCREATHGHHKYLLVGPRRSGKTLLVHALATVTDAILFELDPVHLHSLVLSPAELQRLVNAVLVCARAAQPAVIYIRDIQRLFYRMVHSEDAPINLALMKRLFTRRLLKKINKTDKITVIGTCVDPWNTKPQLLKQFPAVVLVPDTSYSAVFSLLKHWVNENHTIPRELDIHSLAHELRGYSYGQLKDGLRDFLSAERIVKIAVHGLLPMEIYNYFLADETKTKVEYEKYQKWYTDKTQWGKKEQVHIKEQREFRALCEKYAEKARKEKMKKQAATAVSNATTLSNTETEESGK